MYVVCLRTRAFVILRLCPSHDIENNESVTFIICGIIDVVTRWWKTGIYNDADIEKSSIGAQDINKLINLTNNGKKCRQKLGFDDQSCRIERFTVLDRIEEKLKIIIKKNRYLRTIEYGNK